MEAVKQLSHSQWCVKIKQFKTQNYKKKHQIFHQKSKELALVEILRVSEVTTI